MPPARVDGKRKRAREQPVEPIKSDVKDALGQTSAAELDIADAGSSSEEDGEDEQPESDSDVDALPEIDAERSDDEQEAEGKASGSDADEDDEGFDSEDIDNWDGSGEEDDEARLRALASEEEEEEESSGTSSGEDEPLTGSKEEADQIERRLSRAIQKARGGAKPDEGEREYNKLGIDTRLAATNIDPAKQNPDGSSKGVITVSEITGVPKRVYPQIEPDYDSDSSTEETTNRIGNVPLEWYDDYPHIGYDMNGKKVLRPAQGDALDNFLATMEDPESWMTAEDKRTGGQVRLTDEELDIIRRLQNSEIPDASYDPYQPTVEWFTGKGMEMQTPMTGRPEPKSRFVPSKWEHKKIMKIVQAIRQGRIVPRAPAQERPEYFDVWENETVREDHPMHMPAPKLALPGHEESYNPPAEYLLDENERKAWEQTAPEDRKLNFLPSKHKSLRVVPRYENFVQERMDRCLDLYLAPRMRKSRADVPDAQMLLPKLPAPKDLRPFPIVTAVEYKHPSSPRVRSVALDPTGAWAATGAEDGRVRLWNLTTGRCDAVYDLHASSAKDDRAPVYSVAWCPNASKSILVASTVGRIAIIAPREGNVGFAATTSESFQYAIQGFPMGDEEADPEAPAEWVRPANAERERGIAVYIHIPGTAKHVSFHPKGDYFVTVVPDATRGKAVLVHQLSRHRSQAPFRRVAKGSAVQRATFHPTRPHLLVATQRYVRIYDLAQQVLVQTLQTGLRWISSLAVHPSGEHVLVGSYDRKLLWFDLELSTRAYKTLRYHARAVRQVAFHPTLPLFASVADDGQAHIYHATVYSDWAKNAMIVPLKILRGHTLKQGLGILDAMWHPAKPWLLTAGADGQARLWSD